jgi:hypothetical protein
MIRYLNMIINLVDMRILLKLLSIPRIFDMILSRIVMRNASKVLSCHCRSLHDASQDIA